jgi:hypothetical protein
MLASPVAMLTGMTVSDTIPEHVKDLTNNYSDCRWRWPIMDRDTGRSKGFGFVEMGSDTEAQAAIQALNGQEVEGRALTVNEARPREDRGGGRGGQGGGRGGSGGRGGYSGGRDRRY